MFAKSQVLYVTVQGQNQFIPRTQVLLEKTILIHRTIIRDTIEDWFRYNTLMSEKPLTRFEAFGLLNCFSSLEMCFPALLWNYVLERFNKVSNSLQSINIELGIVVELAHSLVEYLEGSENTVLFIYMNWIKSNRKWTKLCIWFKKKT